MNDHWCVWRSSTLASTLHGNTPRRLSAIALTLLLLAPSLGCGRDYFRMQADCEVYGLIEAANSDPRWQLRDYTINLHPNSRLFDGQNPDYPPLPPDDPTAHRLMHHVDCKRGFACWHRNGEVPDVERAEWRALLPRDEQGQLVLDRTAAVQLARLHSREYQSQLENLYLSALDVSFERFRFDYQFFGGGSTFYTADGNLRNPALGSQSTLAASTTFQNRPQQVRKLYASGGQLIAGVANSLVWQLSGPNNYNANTLMNFSFVQPLLRAGGRAVVMERLTIVERNLLANLRQMELYRRGFYIDLMTGAGNTQSVQRRGGVFGGSGLQNFSGVGAGGFGRVGGTGGGGGAGGVAGTGAGANRAGGFLGILQQNLEIQNQVANVTGLRSSLDQLASAYDAGRLDRFQVDLARQNLFLVQSSLLNNRANFQLDLDQFKRQLGLPPMVDLEVRDPWISRFQLIDRRMTETQQSVGQLLNELRQPAPEGQADDLAALVRRAGAARAAVAAQLAIVEDDAKRLEEAATARRDNLRRLSQREEVTSGEVEASPYDVRDFERRRRAVGTDLRALAARFEKLNQRLTAWQSESSQGTALGDRQALQQDVAALDALLGELSLLQARARLDSATLVTVEIEPQRALEIAAENRLDWMNARLGLVDSWRLIEFNANALKSDLNLVFSGDVSSTDNNPLHFNSHTGRLRVGFEFDSPLTRLSERNQYRQALIEYQQARRNYMAFRDGVALGLRNRVRTIRLNQLNFETRRAAVLVAIGQVEQTRLRLDQPPRPSAGQTANQQTLSNTTTRDLVDALNQLLNAQNDFLSVWVNFEVQRLGLDYDLGTMQLDDQHLWIDPGPVTEDTLSQLENGAAPEGDAPASLPEDTSAEPLDTEPQPVEPDVDELPAPDAQPALELPPFVEEEAAHGAAADDGATSNAATEKAGEGVAGETATAQWHEAVTSPGEEAAEDIEAPVIPAADTGWHAAE